FDSGLNEVELQTTGPSESLCLYALELVDDAHYPASPESEASPLVHLWHAEKYVDDTGQRPSVAMGSDAKGAWVVEVHEGPPGQLAFAAATPGTLQKGAPFTSGYAARIAAADEGDLVAEVRQAQPGVGALWCRVGRVAWTPGVEVTWQRPIACGRGYRPAL